MWVRRKVQSGTKTGQKIGYPTLNFRAGDFSQSSGVYACEILIADKLYKGALYFGPRLNHPGNVLEVYVIGFKQKIYGHFVRFRVGKKIRSPKCFNSLDELKKQIQKDLQSV
ncbi:riboflavin kinase [Candidatus Peregrinibacteria bacterium]|nr:riboflavin kinase [Candidatus Peregrinibacteria bacterium]